MSTPAAARFEAEVRALCAGRREEIIAGLAACEPVGAPDPDETPEFMAQLILEHQVWKAADGTTYEHEEVMRSALAPSLRWEAYRADPATLPAEEREAIERAAAIIEAEFGIRPSWWVRARESAKSTPLARIIACLVERREEWQPSPPWPVPFYPVEPGEMARLPPEVQAAIEEGRAHPEKLVAFRRRTSRGNA